MSVRKNKARIRKEGTITVNNNRLYDCIHKTSKTTKLIIIN